VLELHGADEAAEDVDVVDGEIEDDVVAAGDGVGIAADAREREVDGRPERPLADDLAKGFSIRRCFPRAMSWSATP
jgi:hypothetical protein